MKKIPLGVKNLPNDSASEVEESDLASSPAKSKQKVSASTTVVAAWGEEENTGSSSRHETSGKQKGASEMYQKVCLTSVLQSAERLLMIWQLSQLEHVLKRPDSYIGSVEAVTQMMWVYDVESKMMTQR